MTSAVFRLSHLTDRCSGVVLELADGRFTLPGSCAINSRTLARSPSKQAWSRLSVISRARTPRVSKDLTAAVPTQATPCAKRVPLGLRRGVFFCILQKQQNGLRNNTTYSSAPSRSRSVEKASSGGGRSGSAASTESTSHGRTPATKVDAFGARMASQSICRSEGSEEGTPQSAANKTPKSTA